MLRVGLTGGLACGKSFVAGILASLGCHVIQADELGHQVLLPEGEAYRPVLDEFGADILDERGFIDRRKLASLVFADSEKLKKLSAMVHPAVRRSQERIIAELEQTDPRGIAVVEAAILVETGSYLRFDRLIVVACSERQQVERAMHRDSYTREEALARLSRQLPLEEKKRVAHYIIDTSGTKARTMEQTQEVYRSLRSLPT
jgi:dephospho-CoA kinase